MKNLFIASIASLFFMGCSGTEEAKKISIDGSSTVFPLSEAVAELATKDENLKSLRVGVALSGTGGGFKKFCAGEIEIAGASRPIKNSEKELCKESNIDFLELPVAHDGVAVVVNKENTCAQSMTVAQLKSIWEPAAEGKITNWKQVNPSCPDLALRLYGPGHDSGTFDYFTEEIVGTAKSSRSDFTASEDDNVLVTGVAGDKGGLAYFGFAYYTENADKLSLVSIDNGKGPVAPSMKSIASGEYAPLSRPLYIYVSAAALQNPNVDQFLKFFLANSAEMASEVGFVPLGENQAQSEKIYTLVQEVLANRVTGDLFSSSAPNLSVEERLKKSL